MCCKVGLLAIFQHIFSSKVMLLDTKGMTSRSPQIKIFILWEFLG